MTKHRSHFGRESVPGDVGIDGRAGIASHESGTSGYKTNDENGASLWHWNDQLAIYLDRQVGVEQLRHRTMPEFPWPGTENPMLVYLLRRGNEVAITDGLPAALTWLAVHAWFEGAIEAVATIRAEGPSR